MDKYKKILAERFFFSLCLSISSLLYVNMIETNVFLNKPLTGGLFLCVVHDALVA